MPSPKPGNFKQPQSRLTNRRSFGSADSNYSSYGLDNVIETPNNNSQDIGSDYQQNSSNNTDNNNNNDNNDGDSKTWWSKINPSLKLENKASVARDHLGLLKRDFSIIFSS